MIQRIQSLFLLFPSIIFATLFFVPVFTVDGTPVFMIGSRPETLAIGAIALLGLVALFMYRNRKRQMRMCRAGIILSVLYSANLFVFPKWLLGNAAASVVSTGPGSWLLVSNVIFFVLALIFIRKDDELVRSADRLR
ncbi:MAG TPA: DUF4293 domain-containing protein [Bacteroidia bacterium]|nr:DUF4293 domain-containing protein [Bacteroidia bacterium]